MDNEESRTNNNIIDLFAGCGGLSLGFKTAGFDVCRAVEHWPAAIDTYRANIGCCVEDIDLSEPENIAAFRKNRASVIIGGPPCQDFSKAGLCVEAERAALTVVFARIIADAMPPFFVMENVPQAKDSHAYHQAREIFKKHDYSLTEITLDAAYCGVPQHRKRFFCIGTSFKFCSAGFLKPYLLAHQSQNAMTLRQYYEELGMQPPFEYYYRHPRTYASRGIFSIDEPAPTIRGVSSPMPPGYKRHPSDVGNKGDSIRAMTASERALAMTFPQDWHWCGQQQDINQMIGNAVPPRLAAYVASALRYCMRSMCGMDLGLDIRPFSAWLKCSGVREKTASDIISRLHRANRIMPVKKWADADWIAELENASEFDALGRFVKNQLKHAATLYVEYMLDSTTPIY